MSRPPRARSYSRGPFRPFRARGTGVFRGRFRTRGNFTFRGRGNGNSSDFHNKNMGDDYEDNTDTQRSNAEHGDGSTGSETIRITVGNNNRQSQPMSQRLGPPVDDPSQSHDRHNDKQESDGGKHHESSRDRRGSSRERERDRHGGHREYRDDHRRHGYDRPVRERDVTSERYKEYELLRSGYTHREIARMKDKKLKEEQRQQEDRQYVGKRHHSDDRYDSRERKYSRSDRHSSRDRSRSRSRSERRISSDQHPSHSSDRRRSHSSDRRRSHSSDRRRSHSSDRRRSHSSDRRGSQDSYSGTSYSSSSSSRSEYRYSPQTHSPRQPYSDMTDRVGPGSHDPTDDQVRASERPPEPYGQLLDMLTKHSQKMQTNAARQQESNPYSNVVPDSTPLHINSPSVASQGSHRSDPPMKSILKKAQHEELPSTMEDNPPAEAKSFLERLTEQLLGSGASSIFAQKMAAAEEEDEPEPEIVEKEPTSEDHYVDERETVMPALGDFNDIEDEEEYLYGSMEPKDEPVMELPIIPPPEPEPSARLSPMSAFISKHSRPAKVVDPTISLWEMAGFSVPKKEVVPAEPKTLKSEQFDNVDYSSYDKPAVSKSEPNTDPTIANILKSIGFDFDMSRRMQERAKQVQQSGTRPSRPPRGSSKKAEDNPFGVNMSASFLGQNMSDIKSKLFMKEDSEVERFIREAHDNVKQQEQESKIGRSMPEKKPPIEAVDRRSSKEHPLHSKSTSLFPAYPEQMSVSVSSHPKSSSSASQSRSVVMSSDSSSNRRAPMKRAQDYDDQQRLYSPSPERRERSPLDIRPITTIETTPGTSKWAPLKQLQGYHEKPRLRSRSPELRERLSSEGIATAQKRLGNSKSLYHDIDDRHVSASISQSSSRTVLPPKAEPKTQPVAMQNRPPTITPKHRQLLLREKEESAKQIKSLEKEQERLRRQQNELMRKKQRQRDGHKDPVLLENEKLQEEIQRQIQVLHNTAEENSQLLNSAALEFNESDDNLSEKEENRKSSTVSTMKDTRLGHRGRGSVGLHDDVILWVPKSDHETHKGGSHLPSAGARSRSRESSHDNEIRKSRKSHFTQEDKKKSSKVEEATPKAAPVIKTKELEPPKEKEVAKVKEKKEKVKDKIRYEYFDPGNHWCRLCNSISGNVFEVFSHIQTKKHQQHLDPYDRPWMPDSLKFPQKSVGNAQIAPIKGVEFLMSTVAFYCSMCSVFSGDATCAEEHLKSEIHNENYKKHIEKNPFYERRLNLDKAAGISLMPSEDQKSREKRKTERDSNQNEKKSKMDRDDNSSVSSSSSMSSSSTTSSRNRRRILRRSRNKSKRTSRSQQSDRDRASTEREMKALTDSDKARQSEKSKTTEQALVKPKTQSKETSPLVASVKIEKKEEKIAASMKKNSAEIEESKITIKLSGKSGMKTYKQRSAPPWKPSVQFGPRPNLSSRKTVKPKDEPASLDTFLTLGEASNKTSVPVVRIKPATVVPATVAPATELEKNKPLFTDVSQIQLPALPTCAGPPASVKTPPSEVPLPSPKVVYPTMKGPLPPTPGLNIPLPPTAALSQLPEKSISNIQKPVITEINDAKDKADEAAKDKAEEAAKDKADEAAKDKADEAAKDKAVEAAKAKADEAAKDKADEAAKDKADEAREEMLLLGIDPTGTIPLATPKPPPNLPSSIALPMVVLSSNSNTNTTNISVQASNKSDTISNEGKMAAKFEVTATVSRQDSNLKTGTNDEVEKEDVQDKNLELTVVQCMDSEELSVKDTGSIQVQISDSIQVQISEGEPMQVDLDSFQNLDQAIPDYFEGLDRESDTVGNFDAMDVAMAQLLEKVASEKSPTDETNG